MSLNQEMSCPGKDFPWCVYTCVCVCVCVCVNASCMKCSKFLAGIGFASTKSLFQDPEIYKACPNTFWHSPVMFHLVHSQQCEVH